MNERLRRWLDGELDLEDLSPRLRARARRWQTLFEEMRAGRPEHAPAELEDAVMQRVRATEPPGAAEAPAAEDPPAEAEGADPVGRAARALRWLFRPRPVPVPPAAGLAAAVLVAFFVLRPSGGPGAGPPGDGTAPAAAEEAGTRVYAEFVLRAPGADSVSVAGTFTGWEPSVPLRDPDGDGVWSARVPLEPGRHEYMFVVDGRQWVTDPNAQRYASDGFGHRNAVLAVARPTRTGDG